MRREEKEMRKKLLYYIAITCQWLNVAQYQLVYKDKIHTHTHTCCVLCNKDTRAVGAVLMQMTEDIILFKTFNEMVLVALCHTAGQLCAVMSNAGLYLTLLHMYRQLF